MCGVFMVHHIGQLSLVYVTCDLCVTIPDACPNLAHDSCVSPEPRPLCKDCPAGHQLEVSPIKNHSSACAICFYVQRGSFQGVKQLELVKALKEHGPVKEKYLFSNSAVHHSTPHPTDQLWSSSSSGSSSGSSSI